MPLDSHLSRVELPSILYWVRFGATWRQWHKGGAQFSYALRASLRGPLLQSCRCANNRPALVRAEGKLGTSKIAKLIPRWRRTSAVVIPASCSFNIALICSPPTCSASCPSDSLASDSTQNDPHFRGGRDNRRQPASCAIPPTAGKIRGMRHRERPYRGDERHR